VYGGIKQVCEFCGLLDAAQRLESPSRVFVYTSLFEFQTPPPNSLHSVTPNFVLHQAISVCFIFSLLIVDCDIIACETIVPV